MDIQTHRRGSLLGGILLVAGCCIGAGMLGLPVLSALAGFGPSLLTFICCWIFMVCTGLLLLEVNLWFGKDISIITMAKKTLGRPGEFVSWFVFLFLFYSLMVAYTAASGSLISGFVEGSIGVPFSQTYGATAFTLFFGLLLYIGMAALDWFNRALMFGLILTYVVLVFIGTPHIHPEYLLQHEWSAATVVIPAAIVSFGFHNLVPSLTTYFRADVRSLKYSIILGSAIPLIIYVLWEGLILGIVPVSNFKEVLDNGEIATEALRNIVGLAWILDVAQAFAFFAIVTSFLSVALSFVDFLADGLKIKKTALGKLLLISLVLVPPYICAMIYPTIFLNALSFAGGFGAVILFGILPALMVWKGRYTQQIQSPHLVPGGKAMLIGVILISIGVMLLQLPLNSKI